jgi:DNA polymerase III subunit delta
MTAQELERAIAEHRFPLLLYLYGEETFLLERAVQRLREAAVPKESWDFNLRVIHGRELVAARLLEELQTFPVFASRRLVLVKDAQLIPAPQLEGLLDYLKHPLAESLLVLVGDKIDGRKKFFQDFKKHGELVEFKKYYDNQIPAFVREQVKAAGRSLTEDAMALFCRRVNSNLQEIHGELVKLFAYLGERRLIDVADVAAVVSDTRAGSVFDLTNAVGKRQVPEALRLFGRLLEEGIAPLVILAMLVRHFRQLWKARELVERREPNKEIARLIGMNPYFLEGLLAQTRSFSPGELRRAFELFLQTDLALKSSGAHPSALLEQLLLELMSPAKGR